MTPPLDAIRLLRQAVFEMVGPKLVEEGWIDEFGDPRLFWEVDVTGQATLPFVVFFCSSEISAFSYIGAQGAEVLLTLRSTAADSDVAAIASIKAAEGMSSITVGDWRISSRWRSTISLPQNPTGEWQTAQIFQVKILPNS